MEWIYFSPHLDDVALSCGGLAWEQSQSGSPVQVWTICAGDPPARPLSAFAEELHERWETLTRDLAQVNPDLLRRIVDQIALERGESPEFAPLVEQIRQYIEEID